VADAQTQTKNAPAGTPRVDELPARSERERAAARAAQAATEALAFATDFLELVVVRANKTRYGKRLAEWVDPEVTLREQVAVRDSVLSDVVQNSSLYLPGVAAKREYYGQQVEVFVAAVAWAARSWATDSLNKQSQQLFQLLVSTRTNVKHLHAAAKAVRERVDSKTFVLPVMSAELAKEASGQSRSGGTVATRLRRMFYMYATRTGPELHPAEAEAYRNLFRLMAHPRGVKILDEFAGSAETGWSYASEIFSDSLAAIAKLQGNLASDATLIWRFPPAIAAGVASLGYAQRQPLTQFALAWSASRKSRVEEALEMAGNALLVLDLVGGPLGAAVSEILNFVVAVIGTTVSFLRDVEQDQAAAATAFGKRSEKLSEGSRSLGTVLQGLAAVATALAVPGAVSKITGRRTSQVVNLAEAAEKRALRDVPDPRAISPRPVEKEAVDAAERGVGGNAVQPAARRTEETYETMAAGRPLGNQRAEIDRTRKAKEAEQLRNARGNGNLERGVSDAPGVVKPPPRVTVSPSLKSSVPELPLLPKRINSKNYSLEEVTLFYRANRGEYPSAIQKKIDALPLSKAEWAPLQDIDRAIKQVHTDTANAMAGFAKAERKPFIQSVKGTESNEGARLAKVMTDDKSMTLVGQYAGGTVEFDCVQFAESRIVEVKQSFRWNVGSVEHWVPPEEILMQMRKQLQFVDEWKKKFSGFFSEVKWVIRDEESYYLVLGILEKGVGGRRLEAELAAKLKVERFF
jgi:hypothetical protein